MRLFSIIYVLLLLSLSCSILQPSTTTPPSTDDSKTNFNPNIVEVMGWQSDRYLWFGNRAGIVRLNLVDNSFDIFDNISCVHLLVTRISDDVWCSSGNQAYRFKSGTWSHFDIAVRRIIEARDGTVWAGTKQGLSRFDAARQDWEQIIQVSEVAPHFTFSDGGGIALSFQAKDESFWFSSFSEPYVGTTRWTPTSKQTWQPVGKWGVVYPVLEARDGLIWGIADESIIAKWDGEVWQIWQPFRLKPAIRKLIEVKDGSIWILAATDGVGRWDGQSWQIWARDESIIQSCPGVSQGEDCFPTAPDVEYYSANGLGKLHSNQSRLTLTTLLETQNGSIWVGTAQEGISRWDGNEWRNYTQADGLSSEAITVLTESPDGALWAGTWGGGVNLYNPDTDQWQPFP